MGSRKVYVAVRDDFRDDGVMLPREITWEDGKRYEIDRVTDIRQAPSMKAGGQGDRYTIVIRGHQSYLFFECTIDEVIGLFTSPKREEIYLIEHPKTLGGF